MKQHPILFNSAMVRAILDGSKTQTRRLVKERNYPIAFCGFTDNFVMLPENHLYQSPYGTIGDQLWVRETFAYPNDQVTIYRADWREDAKSRGLDNIPLNDKNIKWKPSIFMPRTAARIQLEITNIRIERLNDISESDAIEEGVKQHKLMLIKLFERKNMSDINAYMNLWESINGIGSWAKNPFVWCVSFKVIKP